MDHHPHPHPQPPPSRPPSAAPTPDTKSTTSSAAPTLYEKTDDISEFLRGGGDRPYDNIYKRRRWTHFSLVFMIALFMGSCGGAALSGLLFRGIGVVGGIMVQWIAQSLVMFASVTSLLYVILHIRAALLGRELFDPYNTKYDHQLSPPAKFQHPLHSYAVLTIYAALLLWITAMPAAAMGVYYQGQTILKLDVFVSALGLVSAIFFVVIQRAVEEPFEVAVLSPMYKQHSRTRYPEPKYPPMNHQEGSVRGGGGGGKGKISKSSSSFSSSDGSSVGSGPSPQVPVPAYTGAVGGPRPLPGGHGPGPNVARGRSQRVLTRLPAIDMGGPPGPHPAPTQPAAEEKPRPIVAGVANAVTGWFWPPRGGNGSAPQTGGGAGGRNGDDPGAGRRPVEDFVKEDMPGTFHGGDHRGW